MPTVLIVAQMSQSCSAHHMRQLLVGKNVLSKACAHFFDYQWSVGPAYNIWPSSSIVSTDVAVSQMSQSCSAHHMPQLLVGKNVPSKACAHFLIISGQLGLHTTYGLPVV